jgi:pimeloyl-ACP methyl ester carboxylesterase
MFNYYRLNWPAEPYRERSDSPPPVRAPTLLLHGLDDPYALPAGLNDVWRWIDNGLTIVTLPGAGHFIQHDRAAEVARVLRGWLPPAAHP